MYYIGIDVHKKKCVTTIKGDAKKVLKRTSFDNDITGINGFTGMLRSDGYLPATAACESTGNYWIVLHDTLEAAGIDTLLAHPYHLKIITQTAYKNDKADSEKLAELCRLDMIPESFVVNAAQRDMRELTRSRLALVNDTKAPRNRIHAILARHPYKRPRGGLFTGDGLEWLQNLDLSETDRLGVDTHLAKLVFLRGRIARYEKRVAEIARDDPRARLIMTIPGIGYITAVTILAEIVDHGRFDSAEKLVSYAGLSPRHHNSGETVRTGGITKRGSVWLRTAPYKRPRGGLFTGDGLEWLQNLDLSETDRLGVDTHLAKLVFLRGRIARYEKRVAEIARDDPRARLIMTIPGIGYITAVTILAEIVDHGRFDSAEKLVSYAGLSPRHHNSGETVRTGGITKRGSVWLRTAMVEAAFVAVRHDARIGARYQKLAARIGTMKARVATARVMLEWVWEMLNSGTEYRGINRDLVKRKMQKTRRIAESQA